MLFHKNKEVLVTNQPEVFGRVSQALKDAGIPVKIKTVNNGSVNRMAGEFAGRLGEKTELQIMYYIYVRSEYEEQAKHVIAMCRKQV